MRSRLAIGVTAWILGAATATTGSMIAVSELAHGLLGQQTQQLGNATISADLDPSSGPPETASAPASPRAAASHKRAHHTHRAAQTSRSVAPTASPTPSPTPTPAQTGQSRLLTSSAGTVTAQCQSGGAYLQYWSPNQGYEADDVYRGPAPTAYVTFQSTANSVTMKVTCVSGKPVDHVTKGPPDTGP
ncbi:MAG TPA: hypothetical protein VEV61_16105 [Streptosporangiaceae bacterium]|nr:hypothetical protein [Streptosporangiaceae bacterium]